MCRSRTRHGQFERVSRRSLLSLVDNYAYLLYRHAMYPFARRVAAPRCGLMWQRSLSGPPALWEARSSE